MGGLEKEQTGKEDLGPILRHPPKHCKMEGATSVSEKVMV